MTMTLPLHFPIQNETDSLSALMDTCVHCNRRLMDKMAGQLIVLLKWVQTKAELGYKNIVISWNKASSCGASRRLRYNLKLPIHVLS